MPKSDSIIRGITHELTDMYLFSIILTNQNILQDYLNYLCEYCILGVYNLYFIPLHRYH